MGDLEYISVNTRGAFRRASLNGRPHLVVRSTLIRSGVLAGSRGRLFYPPEEVVKNYDSWDGLPVTWRHPKLDGQHVKARDPHVLNLFQVGQLFGSRASNGTLTSELWLDEARLREFDDSLPDHLRVTPRLLSGKPVELSTGLFTDNTPVDPHTNPQHKGKPYDFVARNYRPDHLALLPDEVGACSVSDGCGVGIVNAGNPKSVSTGKFKPYGSGTGRGDVHEAAQGGAFDHRTMISQENRARGADARAQAEAGRNPPDWAVDEDVWEKAKAAADKGDYEGDTYYAVVAHVYQRMGGTVGGGTENATTLNYIRKVDDEYVIYSEDGKELGSYATEAEAKKRLAQIEYFKHKDSRNAESGADGLPNLDEDCDMATRAENVQVITTNCKCQEETLNEMSDQEVQDLANKIREGNDARRRLKAVANGVVVNANGARVRTTAAQFVANAAGEYECEAGMDPEECKKMMAEGEGAGKKAPPAPPAANSGGSMSPEDRKLLAEAKRVTDREKLTHVRKIVANVTNEAVRTKWGNELMAKDLSELEELSAAIGQADESTRNSGGGGWDFSTPPQDSPAANYFGAQGGPVANFTAKQHADGSSFTLDFTPTLGDK